MAKEVSTRGRAFLKAHEGEALKAYRCPAGRWTIGVGLTAASGVVKPRAGMTISRAESDRLLSAALSRNYGPRVAKAMPGAAQHAFDGGASFDFNTGAIDRASWARLWRAKAAADRVRSALGQWTRGGGRVLPGLKRRRAEEADIILLDRWPAHLALPAAKASVAFAGWHVALSDGEKEAVREALARLGYDPGPQAGEVRLEAATRFQRDHDLAVDGLIGRATLSALQRELDARKGVLKGGGAATGGGAIAGGPSTGSGSGSGAGSGSGSGTSPGLDPSAIDPAILDPALVSLLGFAVLALAGLYLAWLAFHYRDLIAVRVQALAPRLAAFLRSF